MDGEEKEAPLIPLEKERRKEPPPLSFQCTLLPFSLSTHTHLCCRVPVFVAACHLLPLFPLISGRPTNGRTDDPKEEKKGISSFLPFFLPFLPVVQIPPPLLLLYVLLRRHVIRLVNSPDREE